MKGRSCFFFCRVLSGLVGSAGGGPSPGHRLRIPRLLWCLLLGPRFLFILCRVLEVISENGPSVQAQPGSIAQLLRGQTWIPPTPRNHSNRLWAADEGCASAPVRHMVYDGNRKYDGDGPVTAWKDKLTAGKVQHQRGKGLITLTV